MLRDFVTRIHKKTARDYLARVNEFPKAEAAKIAKRFDRDYWDGDRKVGYGGFKYDGRWKPAAEAMVEAYGLKAGMSVLDVGCGKAFLLHDLAQAVPGLKISGVDVSSYAIKNAPEPVRPFLQTGTAVKLPYPDKAFDLVISINALHNLEAPDLFAALREIERVGKRHKYICVESWRNEEEKTNLLYWQLTCETFASPRAWEWWFQIADYTGDHEFIYFE